MVQQRGNQAGPGLPTDWENQEKYKGGWIRKINGKLQPRMGNRAMLLGKMPLTRICRGSTVLQAVRF